MKKLTVLLILVLPLFLTACSVKNPFAKGGVAKQLTEKLNSSDSNGNDNDISGSIFDLVNQDKNITCTFGDDQKNFSGTIYVANKKVRSDFTTTAANQAIEGHSIIDGDWVYTWTSMLPRGTKMNVADLKSAANGAEDKDNKGRGRTDDVQNGGKGQGIAEQAQERTRLNEKFNYHCFDWTVDESKFNLPEDITFTDTTDLIENVQKNVNMCAACDYIQNVDKKASCRKSLNCD